MRIKYICIKDCEILMEDPYCRCSIEIGECLYLTFAYQGAFGDRYLIYIDPHTDNTVGSLYNKDLKNFEEYRENTINKILKN